LNIKTSVDSLRILSS